MITRRPRSMRRFRTLALCAVLGLLAGCSRTGDLPTKPRFARETPGRTPVYSGTPTTWRVAAVIVTPREGQWVVGTTPVDPVAVVSNLMFGDANGHHVKGLYAEMSYGRQLIDMGPDDVFRYDLTSLANPPAPGNSAAQAWRAEADSMSGGAYATGYDRIIYIFPPQTYFPQGDAERGGVCYGTVIEIYDFPNASNYAHELGHSVPPSLDHSSDTPDDGYSDLSCVMGGTFYAYNAIPLRHMNALQKLITGWIDSDADTSDAGEDALDLTRSGTYVISALTTNPANAAEPTVLRYTDPVDQSRYVISYRTATGIFDGDSFLNGNTFVAQGRAYYGSNGVGSTNIHRMRSGGGTQFLACLNPGSLTWQSPTGEIVVTQTNATAGNGTVSVQIVGHPSASIAPAVRFGRGLPGINLHTGLTYTLVNPDDAAHTYDLSWTAPAGVSLVMAPTLAVGAHSTGSTPVLLEFASQMPDGDVVFTVTATEGATEVSTNGTYRVDNTAPSTPTLLNATTCTPSDLTWSASTDAGSGMGTYQVYRDGVMVGEATGTTFTDGAVQWGGTRVYKVRAGDALGNLSAFSNTISVALVPGPVSISPAQHSGNGATGIPIKKRYTVTVTNRQCGSGSDIFNLSSTSPQWFTCLMPATVTVPRGGGTAQFVVTLNFTEQAPSGTHVFTIQATDADQSSYTVSVQGSYLVTP